MLDFSNPNSFNEVRDEAEKIVHLMWALQKQYDKYDPTEFVRVVRKYTKHFNDIYDMNLQSDYYEDLKQLLQARPEDSWGTCLQGTLRIGYDEIMQVMNKHNIQAHKGSDDGKTDVNWYGKFSDGRIFTIYNWKNGKAYLGDQGLDIQRIRDWHVGGKEVTTYQDLKLVFEMELGKIL
jgi:hypothetical protein